MISDIQEKIKAEGDKLSLSLKEDSSNHVWRIKVDGNYIKIRSGKTVWERIGHAKLALRNHFNSIQNKFVYHHYKHNKSPAHDIREIFEEHYQKFLDERVEFVEVTK